MKRFSIILCLFCCFVNVSKSQNLIPNGSFEDTISCPEVGNVTIIDAQSWNNNAWSPDYFNPCSNTNSVPYNFAGYQYPADGLSYSGIIAYTTFFSNPQWTTNYREYIGTFLTTSLSVGSKYFFSLKVCLAVQPDLIMNSASNKMGARFSIGNPGLLTHDNYSDICFNTIITDSINWTSLKGSFIADSIYNYITIGNFYDNANTQIINVISDVDYSAYYYIDDLRLSLDSIYVGAITNLNNSEYNYNNIHMSPNPTFDVLNINTDRDFEKIEILSISGKILLSEYVKNKSYQLQLHNLEEGIYFVKVTYINKQSVTKKLVKQN
ncbi:MAG: T9SS type A sorting domain-containing protein [Burkholderiales bacterium]|nr:T9SS type A sorting domain-containing protein [Bacteroidia bacterium]